MANVAVTCNLIPNVVLIRAVMSSALSHLVAEAFTKSRVEDNEVQKLLRDNFEEREYRWYCIDQSSHVQTVTYSDDPNPIVAQVNGDPAAIVGPGSAPFRLQIQFSELIKPGRLNPNLAHPCAVV